MERFKKRIRLLKGKSEEPDTESSLVRCQEGSSRGPSHNQGEDDSPNIGTSGGRLHQDSGVNEGDTENGVEGSDIVVVAPAPIPRVNYSALYSVRV